MMKTLTVFLTALISAAVLFSTPASAEVSRAQVLAELAQARANGELPDYGTDFAYTAPVAKTAGKTRAEVIAELKAAREDGTLEALNSDAGLSGRTEQTRLAASKATNRAANKAKADATAE